MSVGHAHPTISRGRAICTHWIKFANINIKVFIRAKNIYTVNFLINDKTNFRQKLKESNLNKKIIGLRLRQIPQCA